MILIDKLRFQITKKVWRKRNKHNRTYIAHETDISKISVGKNTYGPLNVFCAGESGVLKIGHFCSIAGDVTFVVSADHPVNNISTYPYKVLCVQSQPMEAISKGNIIVADDVWIGYHATILSGVHIGQGAVVAAGAVVTNNVPPYAIVGGVPAKIIKYRFSQEIIDALMHVDYSKLEQEQIKQHLDVLYQPLVHPDQISWMPKK